MTARPTAVFAALFLVAVPPALAQGMPDGTTVAPVVQRVTPAVVNISTRSRDPARENPLLNDPFFRRFFDLPRDMPRRDTTAAGSGVIVDARRGTILTNAHVVEDADVIEVVLKDNRVFPARLVGRDPLTDIAVLDIDADRLTDVPLGDSGRVAVGDFVLAVGNPFGLGQTVTSGIVSAIGRSGLGIEGYEDFIQTDASINPGNSGGALVNFRGELIGINTAILAPGGGNIGIGFAVPVNMARAVMDQLVEHGEVRRGRIGVAIQDLTPQLSQALEASSAEGAVVAGVESGAPADRAGLKRGDVIVAIDGSPVRSATEVRNRIGLTRAGGRVTITVERDGRRRDFDVRVEPQRG
ncbi:MAG: Do family serine endopeptidase [Pseudomonadota bacterium]